MTKSIAVPECPTELFRPVAIFAAVSTGCLALSQSIGLPLVHLGISRDPLAGLAALNACHHASAVPWSGSFQAFKDEEGWADWRLVSFEPGLDVEGLPTGVMLAEGCIKLNLPVELRPATFAAEVFAALRHLRLDAVVTSPAWLHARSAICEPLHIPARYTLADHDARGSGARLVDDLFVLDPGWHLTLVGGVANSARAAFLRRRARGRRYGA